MIVLEKINAECYQAKGIIVRLGHEDLDFLGSAIRLSDRHRSRICAHRSTAEALHEMFVIYGDTTYVRANKHVGKDESVFVIRGEADFVFFTDGGAISKVVPMGDVASGKAYYCRVPQGVFHTIIMRSPETVLFEATPGPFNPADTVYAKWAPREDDHTVMPHYIDDLKLRVAIWKDADGQVRDYEHHDGRALLSKIDERVFLAAEDIVALNAADNAFLCSELSGRSLDRVRICVHKSIDDRLHEMLMAFSRETYIRPSLHVNKEESLFCLEGLATYVFFDEHGRPTCTVPLGPFGSGRAFYCRVPANTYHALVVESDRVLVKETTSGPFKRDATVFASWSPDCGDANVALSYINSFLKG